MSTSGSVPAARSLLNDFIPSDFEWNVAALSKLRGIRLTIRGLVL